MISSYILDNDRFELVEFPYVDVGKFSAILYSPRKVDEPEMLRLFKIFSNSVWLLIFLSYMTLVFLNMVIRPNEFFGKIEIALDYFRIFWMQSKFVLDLSPIMNIFDKKQSGINLKRKYSGSLLLIWLMSSFILIQYFTNDFRAMIISNTEESIESLDDLFERNYKIYMIQKVYEIQKIKKVV